MSNEWVPVPREPTDEMLDAAQNNSDAYRLDLVNSYRAMLDAAPAAPQQAEPVWARPDQLRQVPFLCSIYSTKVAPDLVPLYLHPPAAEAQRLRDAARDVCEWADAAQWALGNETGVPAAKLDALRRALKGGER